MRRELISHLIFAPNTRRFDLDRYFSGRAQFFLFSSFFCRRENANDGLLLEGCSKNGTPICIRIDKRQSKRNWAWVVMSRYEHCERQKREIITLGRSTCWYHILSAFFPRI